MQKFELTQEEYDKRRAETIAAWKRIGDAPIVETKKPEQGAGVAGK